MNEHVEKWLAAYHDGELSGRRLQRVEAHLAVCEPCMVELEKLASVSALLQEAPPLEDLLPGSKFVSQVGLQLPRRQTPSPGQRVVRGLWWAAPALLLMIYVFTTAVLTQARWLGFLIDLGVWEAAARVTSGGTALANWNPLIWTLGISAVVGLGLLGWLASWWIQSGNNPAGNGTE